jgi:hypothetical protein
MRHDRNARPDGEPTPKHQAERQIPDGRLEDVAAGNDTQAPRVRFQRNNLGLFTLDIGTAD